MADDPKSLDEALAMFQADPPLLTKDKSGQAGNQKTKYADLPQVNRIVLSRLNELGVIYVCAPTLDDDGKFVLDYRLTHVPSSTGKAGRYPLKLSENAQQMGSAITYARRYVLLSLTGVAAEDEDDDGADGRRTAQRATQHRVAGRLPATEGESRPTAQRAAQQPRGLRPPLPGEDPNGSVGQDQHRHMRALWRELGYDGDANRDARLAITAKILSLPDLESSSDLTRAEADQVIAALVERRDRTAKGGES